MFMLLQFFIMSLKKNCLHIVKTKKTDSGLILIKKSWYEFKLAKIKVKKNFIKLTTKKSLDTHLTKFDKERTHSCDIVKKIHFLLQKVPSLLSWCGWFQFCVCVSFSKNKITRIHHAACFIYETIYRQGGTRSRTAVFLQKRLSAFSCELIVGQSVISFPWCIQNLYYTWT